MDTKTIDQPKTIDCRECGGSGVDPRAYPKEPQAYWEADYVEPMDNHEFPHCPKCGGSGQMTTEQINAEIVGYIRGLGVEWGEKGAFKSCASNHVGCPPERDCYECIDFVLEDNNPNAWGDTDVARRAAEAYFVDGWSLHHSTAQSEHPPYAFYGYRYGDESANPTSAMAEIGSHAICRALILAGRETSHGE